MSAAVTLGVGASIGLGFSLHKLYTIHQSWEGDKRYIQALEEEIYRLKREMRICGIPVSTDTVISPSPSPSPSSSPFPSPFPSSSPPSPRFPSLPHASGVSVSEK